MSYSRSHYSQVKSQKPAAKAGFYCWPNVTAEAVTHETNLTLQTALTSPNALIFEAAVLRANGWLWRDLGDLNPQPGYGPAAGGGKIWSTGGLYCALSWRGALAFRHRCPGPT